jgi:hypothetical protein
VAKTVSVVPAKGKWSVAYLGFCSAGWTNNARSYAEGLTRGGGGENWRSEWARLVDLETIDNDLVRLMPMVEEESL